LLLFKPFLREIELKNYFILWKFSYINDQNIVETLHKKFVYNLNPNNKYGDEWDVLESKVKETQKSMKLVYGKMLCVIIK
jgi:hypothetical protein